MHRAWPTGWPLAPDLGWASVARGTVLTAPPVPHAPGCSQGSVQVSLPAFPPEPLGLLLGQPFPGSVQRPHADGQCQTPSAATTVPALSVRRGGTDMTAPLHSAAWSSAPWVGMNTRVPAQPWPRSPGR